ncbi:MAG: hypothetical protein ABFD00_01215 [Chloroherpetonaceae bacterium]
MAAIEIGLYCLRVILDRGAGTLGPRLVKGTAGVAAAFDASFRELIAAYLCLYSFNIIALVMAIQQG